MKGYSTDKIRNVILLGHGGCGKTTFLEAALLATGAITRMGKVEDGNTTSDYDKMEIEKKHSINTTLVPVEYQGYSTSREKFVQRSAQLHHRLSWWMHLLECR